jgi:hypothetical protein
MLPLNTSARKSACRGIPNNIGLMNNNGHRIQKKEKPVRAVAELRVRKEKKIWAKAK